MTKAERIRRTAKRTKRVNWEPVAKALEEFVADVKSGSGKWGPEIARVVSLEQDKAEAVRETLEAEAAWVKKRKSELDAEWKASEGQSASDVIRGQWLAYDEMLEKHLQPKLDRLRRAAK